MHDGGYVPRSISPYLYVWLLGTSASKGESRAGYPRGPVPGMLSKVTYE
jgi:hypothetical protein